MTRVVFQKAKEFLTESVMEIDGEYYAVTENGGYGGAYQDKDRPPRAEIISQAEARRLGLEMGYPLETVAERTGATLAAPPHPASSAGDGSSPSED